MKIAVVQMRSAADKADNVARALELIARAARHGARFILLPEVFNFRGRLSTQTLPSIAEPIPGDSTRPFFKLAREKGVYVLLGSIYERAPRSWKVYNTSVLIGPQGRLLAKYRKIHLFDAVLGRTAVRESDFFLAGRKPVVADVDGFSVGLSVCYDLRFPELYRAYARAGAQILCVPSAFTRPTGQAHYEILLRARAVENLCYVLAPNQAGADARGIPSYGNSMVVGPWGEVLSRASAQREEVIFSTVNHSTLAAARRILPAISGQRR